jgi:hypothetical protein
LPLHRLHRVHRPGPLLPAAFTGIQSLPASQGDRVPGGVHVPVMDRVTPRTAIRGRGAAWGRPRPRRRCRSAGSVRTADLAELPAVRRGPKARAAGTGRLTPALGLTGATEGQPLKNRNFRCDPSRLPKPAAYRKHPSRFFSWQSGALTVKLRPFRALLSSWPSAQRNGEHTDGDAKPAVDCSRATWC